MSRLLSFTLAVSLGVGPHVAHAASPYAGLQDPLKQQQMEYAKQQFAEGEKLLADGKAAEAVKKYETAYQYAPELHLLNYNIGVAAMQAGDCVKAKTAFQRFLDLVPEHEMRGDAQQQLLEIERSGCAKTAAPPPGPVTDEDAPDLTSKRPGSDDEGGDEQPDDGDGKRDRPRKMNTLMLAGVGLMAGGGALLLSGGIAGLVALSNAKKLNQLGMGGPTGFSPNSYEDDSIFRLDVGRKNAAITSAILMPLGGALLVTGVALFVVGHKKKKAEKASAPGEGDGADKAAARRRRVRVTGVGPTWLRGGGGVSASFSFGL